MAHTYRQAEGGWSSKLWHFCSNCPDWPAMNYKEWDGWGAPKKWDWCAKCIEIDKDGRCGNRSTYW